MENIIVKTIGSSTFFALIFYLMVEKAHAEQDGAMCTTPDGLRGTCTFQYSCESFINLLESNSNPLYVIETINAYSCGIKMEQKICCAYTVPPRSPRLPSRSFFKSKTELLPTKDCGLTFITEKIFGADPAGVFEFPWMARLLYKDRSENEMFNCGGTVINKRYILTAAHCITFELTSVRVGEFDYNTTIDCETYEGKAFCAPLPQDFDIEQKITFPTFNQSEAYNDIALIRLSTPIDLKHGYVKAICLPVDKSTTLLEETPAFLTGWGSTKKGETISTLLKLKVKTTNRTNCQEIYPNRIFSDRDLCVGKFETDSKIPEGSCVGDSGNPLQSVTLVNNDSRYVQYGILSFRKQAGCTTSEEPRVYMNVSSYIDWIVDNIKP